MICRFFSAKILKFVMAQFYYFFLRFDFKFIFKLSAFQLLRGRQTPLVNSESVKVKT